MDTFTSCAVVIPVYNSATSLPELVSRLERVFSSLGPSLEIVLVNDGSRDESWQVISELAARHRSVRGIDLARNYGQHNALLCGTRAARSEVVITMDDDLQHPPEEIPALLAKLAEGHDVVYGVPESERHDLWRKLASKITKWALQTTMGARVARKVSAFRALRTDIRRAFADYRGPFVSFDVLLTWGAYRFESVVVRHESRPLGVSQYTFRKLVIHALNMVTGFSVLPLQLASLTGFALTLFGMGVLAYVVSRYLIQGVAVPGFAFLASIISIFSGAQLFALGILGEYLARMHFRLMDRPAYTVRTLTDELEDRNERRRPL